MPIVDVVMLACGIAALIAGGESVVRGSVVIARVLGVPPLVVGLTLVAFGTSAPELGLNLVAAFNGNSELSFGNVVGSNMANIGLVLGLAALLRPLVIDASVVKRELPMMLGLSVFAALLCVFPMLPGEHGGSKAGALGRVDAIALLVAFVIVLLMIFKAGGIEAPEDPFRESAEAQAASRAGRRSSLVRAGAFLLLGLGLLVGGGWLSERGAVGIAESLGWSDDLIGLTVVAVATSLPELVTSLVAVRRGEVDIAVGNVVGSNIFNLSLVLPATALVSPVPTPAGGMLALVVMLALSALLVPMARFGPRGGGGAALVSRVEALVLLGVYVGYMVWRATTAGG